ncbi:MAG: nitrate- and nitrite sensing domain-containing protein, partial [Pseudomonadota bacterium]
MFSAFFKSFRAQLLLLIALPLAGMIVTSGVMVVNQTSEVRQYETLLPLVDVAKAASGLAHELQKERGQTVGLITSGWNETQRANLNGQRALSDTAKAGFLDVLAARRGVYNGAEATSLLETLERQIAAIADHRAKVNASSMTVGENVAFYTGTIENLIQLIARTGQSSPSVAVSEQLASFLALVQTKEHAGLERAIGAALFNMAANGEFALARYQAYYARLANETAALKQFHDVA